MKHIVLSAILFVSSLYSMDSQQGYIITAPINLNDLGKATPHSIVERNPEGTPSPHYSKILLENNHLQVRVEVTLTSNMRLGRVVVLLRKYNLSTSIPLGNNEVEQWFNILSTDFKAQHSVIYKFIEKDSNGQEVIIYRKIEPLSNKYLLVYKDQNNEYRRENLEKNDQSLQIGFLFCQEAQEAFDTLAQSYEQQGFSRSDPLYEALYGKNTPLLNSLKTKIIQGLCLDKSA